MFRSNARPLSHICRLICVRKRQKITGSGERRSHVCMARIKFMELTNKRPLLIWGPIYGSVVEPGFRIVRPVKSWRRDRAGQSW